MLRQALTNEFAPTTLLPSNPGKYSDALCVLGPILRNDEWFADWLATSGRSVVCHDPSKVEVALADTTDVLEKGGEMNSVEHWTARVQALIEWATAACFGVPKDERARACAMVHQQVQDVLESSESVEQLAPRIVRNLLVSLDSSPTSEVPKFRLI
jgi:hypothetical protein